MTNEEIIEKIRTTLAEEFEVDIDVIQPDAPLMETLELDSLDLVDMVVLVEKEFRFQRNRTRLCRYQNLSRTSTISLSPVCRKPSKYVDVERQNPGRNVRILILYLPD